VRRESQPRCEAPRGARTSHERVRRLRSVRRSVQALAADRSRSARGMPRPSASSRSSAGRRRRDRLVSACRPAWHGKRQPEARREIEEHAHARPRERAQQPDRGIWQPRVLPPSRRRRCRTQPLDCRCPEDTRRTLPRVGQCQILRGASSRIPAGRASEGEIRRPIPPAVLSTSCDRDRADEATAQSARMPVPTRLRTRRDTRPDVAVPKPTHTR
jgi:hypothetical protein